MMATVPPHHFWFGTQKNSGDEFLCDRVYKFIAIYILFAVCIKTSVSIFVIQRHLVQMNCMKHVILDGLQLFLDCLILTLQKYSFYTYNCISVLY
jgi:hypothetical protein